MPNWSEWMQQTFEYYIVDPGTWKDSRKLDNVTSCTIQRDSDTDTLGSATIDITGMLNECYVRVYLVTIQNGISEKHPLGTFLVQSPSTDFDGKIQTTSLDAYTPLIELKENQPPLGYSLLKNDLIMDKAYLIAQEKMRAPVVKAVNSEKLSFDFVANTEDDWLTFLTDLITNAKYEFSIDELGRILFSPVQDTASLQPIYTYSDDNNSILYPEVSTDQDMYGIPNVVEVIYSKGSDSYYSRVVNDDPNSPVSTVNRGREIVHRDSDPAVTGEPTERQIKQYAENLLKELSSIEYKITYEHGYCPVRVGDCVRINYKRAGLTDIKAKVISQSIKCKPGAPVKEKAIFSMKLWG